METGMALEPALHGGCLMGGVVVGNEVQVQMVKGLSVDLFQEPKKLGGAMAGLTFTDDRAAGHIESGEQRRGPVTLIIMGHGAGAALLHRQPRLGAVESLDLALFVDGKHQCSLGRIKIETNDILDLLGKVGIVGNLEAPYQMRLEAVLVPDTLYARVADAHLFGHHPHAPMRGVGRAFLDRLLNQLELDLGADRLLAGRLGSAFEQARDTALDEIVLPAPDRGLGDLDLAHDRHNAVSLSRQNNNLRPLDDLLGGVAVSYNSLELGAILRTEHNFNSTFAHPPNESDSPQNRIQLFVTEH